MQPDTTPSSLPERASLPFEITLLILFAILTGGMAFWAMLNLITDQGSSLWFKAGLIAQSYRLGLDELQLLAVSQ